MVFSPAGVSKNTFLWNCAVLLMLFVTVESLRCNTCDVKILGSCLGDTPRNCSKGEDRCFSAVATFSADILPIYHRGCIAAAKCENVTDQSILYVKYNISMRCCDTDLCNGATSVQLPLTAGLAAALVAVWSQWGL